MFAVYEHGLWPQRPGERHVDAGNHGGLPPGGYRDRYLEAGIPARAPANKSTI